MLFRVTKGVEGVEGDLELAGGIMLRPGLVLYWNSTGVIATSCKRPICLEIMTGTAAPQRHKDKRPIKGNTLNQFTVLHKNDNNDKKIQCV